MDPDDIYGIGEVLRKIAEGNEENPSLPKTNYAQAREQEVRTSVKDPLNISMKEIIKLLKEGKRRDSSLYGGGGDLNNFYKEYKHQLEKILEEVQIDAVLFAKMETAVKSLGMQLSKYAVDSGAGPKPFKIDSKQAKGNAVAQEQIKEFIPPIQRVADSIVDKFLAFFGADRQQAKTRMRQFREDLVEGLSRSKFIGGAFTDLIRLGTLFAASWLKDKGPLGKALAVGLVVAGPIIAAAIIKGITSLLTNMASKLAIAVFSGAKFLVGKLGSLVGNVIKAIWASKALSGLRGGLVSLGLGGKGKAFSTAANAGRALAPGVTGFMADAALAGTLASSASKAGSKVVPSAITGPLKGILGIAGKALPWILRLGKLFNVVGWIWLGIEAIVGIVRWWKNRKGDKDKKSNGISSGDNIGISEVSDQGITEETKKGNQQVSESSGTLGGRQVTSGFGWRTHPVYGDEKFHSGIDLAYNKGEAVNALMGGKVISAQWQQGYGNTVRVQDKNGYVHLYGHLDSLGVKPGQTIKRGQYLGAAGMTGTATGVHTHYGVAKDASWAQSSWVDPLAYLGAHEPDALKKGEKSGLVYKDKTTQNIVDYWDSKGKNKGKRSWKTLWLGHENSQDYAKLAKDFKKEYAKSKEKELGHKLHAGALEALENSQEAKDYANKKMADYVAKAKAEAVSKTTSIRVNSSGGTREKAQEVKDATPSATEQANAQWSNINREFKEEANKQVIIPPEKQPILDFAGTETCSKVLQNTLNAQQQMYKQY